MGRKEERMGEDKRVGKMSADRWDERRKRKDNESTEKSRNKQKGETGDVRDQREE